MNKLLTLLIAALVLLCTVAAPALARRYEYNFNTCRYSTYSSINPMAPQSVYVPTRALNTGVGQPNAAADDLKRCISVSVYEQTPQRTLVMPNFRPQTQVVSTNSSQWQTQTQRPAGYYYVPGQNAASKQNKNQGSVGYQYNSSGTATYDSAASNNNTATYSNP